MLIVDCDSSFVQIAAQAIYFVSKIVISETSECNSITSICKDTLGDNLVKCV